MKLLAPVAALVMLFAGAHAAEAAPSPAPPRVNGVGAQPATPKASPGADTKRSQAEQRVIDGTRRWLGSSLADAMQAQQQLAQTMADNGQQQQTLQDKISASQAKIDSLDAEIQRLSADIDQTQGRIDQERAQIRALARGLYTEPSSILLRLAATTGVRDAMTVAGDTLAAADKADKIKQRLDADLKRLTADHDRRQADREQEAKAMADHASAMERLQTISLDQQDLSSQLAQSIDECRAQLGALLQAPPGAIEEAASLLVQRQLDLITQAAKQVWVQAQLWAEINGGPAPAAFVAPMANSAARPAQLTGSVQRSSFAWPERGATITQVFGPTTFALEPAGFGYAHFHAGLDMANDDRRILAPLPGVVAAVGLDSAGYGNYIILVHGGGYSTLYGHLAAVGVSVSEVVKQGQQIGVEGSTGMSTGPHLHFELRVGGRPIDPAPYLDGRVTVAA